MKHPIGVDSISLHLETPGVPARVGSLELFATPGCAWRRPCRLRTGAGCADREAAPGK